MRAVGCFSPPMAQVHFLRLARSKRCQKRQDLRLVFAGCFFWMVKKVEKGGKLGCKIREKFPGVTPRRDPP